MDELAQHREKFLHRQRQKRHLAAAWARLAGLAPGMTVLDIGSGPGILASEYAKLLGPSGTIYALEPNLAPTEPAANLIHLRQTADAAIVLPTPPDIVFLTDVLHHAADPSAILAAVRAACAPHTKILVTEYDPAGPGLLGAKPHRRMATAATSRLLQDAGFTILSVTAAEDEHYAILAAPA